VPRPACAASSAVWWLYSSPEPGWQGLPFHNITPIVRRFTAKNIRRRGNCLSRVSLDLSGIGEPAYWGSVPVKAGWPPWMGPRFSDNLDHPDRQPPGWRTWSSELDITQLVEDRFIRFWIEGIGFIIPISGLGGIQGAVISQKEGERINSQVITAQHQSAWLRAGARQDSCQKNCRSDCQLR